MSVVKLLSRKENILRISGIDMIEGTPVLDIKPYTHRDQKEDIRLGWIDTVTNKASEEKNPSD